MRKGSCYCDNIKAQRVAAGHSISRLASLSNTSDWIIRQLENGGNCEVYEAQRIADALSISLATLGKRDI